MAQNLIFIGGAIMHNKLSNLLEVIFVKHLVISYFFGGKKCLCTM